MRRNFTFLFSLIVFFMMGINVWAGDNDLCWSYDADNPIQTTEKSGSMYVDNGLYYASYVNDAAGTNMGLHGVKLNSSGYCYFAKAAVEGTLKLTISNRKNSTAYAVSVYKCTIVDGVATKGDLIADTEETTGGPGTVSVDIPSDVTGIYIIRKTAAEGVLCKIQFIEKVARTFTDFEINLQGDPYTVTLPENGTLPEGVTVEGTFHDNSHGYTKNVITVPVDGTIKFSLGGCQYSGTAFVVTNKTGDKIATVDNKTAKCYHQDKSVATYLYVADAGTKDTLTFTGVGNSYLPYFKAEATEVHPATITYKDQNGNVLGTKNCYEGDALGEIPYTESDLTIAEGYKFRGWIYNTNIKVTATDIITGNITISALVTAVEGPVSVGSIQTYDLTQKSYYPEDHETISITGGTFHDTTHGWSFGNASVINVDVAGKAEVILTECQYSNAGTITVTDAKGNVVASDVQAKVDADGGTVAVKYDGEATTLSFTFSATAYVHKVTVFNVQNFLEKDEASGYYIVPAGDAAALVLAFNEANATPDTKIFLPAGIYDLGETTGTTLSGNNTSIVGESATKTIIRNCPPIEKEGLGSADLLLNTGTGLYMQDLTLKNDLDYYKAGTGRAAVLHDKGTKTIIKNVNFRSYQDTYYSNKVGAYYYFENDTLQGTVDYLCGDGRVYYNKCTLFNAKRSSGDTMTANSELYVFNKCNVVCEDDATTYNFGRAWSDDNNGAGPTCVYLNTTLTDNGDKLISTRWNTTGINVDYGIAGEYNTLNSAGENITPESNSITFSKKSKTLNTILSADAQTTYSIENVLGDWAATAQSDAVQITEIPAEGVFLVEGAITTVKPASGMVRVANGRGGFGPEIDVATAISAVTSTTISAKAPVYNVAGQRVNVNAKGILIQNGHKYVK